MFIHLGAQVSISDEDIIAILSIGAIDESKLTAEFLRFRRDLGRVVSVDKSVPKSIVITPDTVYLSPISVSTLRRRYEESHLDLPSLRSINVDKPV